MSILAVPSTRAFRFFVLLPATGLLSYHLYVRLANTFVYEETGPGAGKAGEKRAGKDEGGEGPAGKSWYQISKVHGAEGTYRVLGLEFQSPKMLLLTCIRNYMGGVIKEVLADEKVNKEGLNFLDRAFRHPQTHEAG